MFLLVVDVANLRAKFEISNFHHFRDMEGLKILKNRSCDPFMTL